MLKPEDCKPGVEVIAIKNRFVPGNIKPLLSIGAIYTIKSYHDSSWNYLNQKDVIRPNILLNEVENTTLSPSSLGWGYFLEQFKLRNIGQLEILFELNNIPQHIKDEVLQKENV